MQIVEEPVSVPVFTIPGSLVVNPDTKRKLEDIRNNFVKIENSNQVSTFKLSDYQRKHGQTASDVPQNFLSRLNTQVQTIDFNDMTTYSMPSSSQGLVTIHKRERSNEITLSPPLAGFSQPPTIQKKRKLVLIPQQTVNLISTDDEDTDSGESKDDPSRQAPEDRVELLKVIKSSINMNKYKSFLTALTNYKNDRDFGTLMVGLLDAFDRPELYYLLRSMQRFVKGEHEAMFHAKIKEVCG